MTVDEIALLVRQIHKLGGNPKEIVMWVEDFEKLRAPDGRRWDLLAIAGLPIRVDVNCPPEKVYVL